MIASIFSLSSNAGLLHPDSNPTEFNVFVHSRSHAAAASRVPHMGRCNRQTIPGGSSASGGGSTYNSRKHFAAQMCLLHVNETHLQWSIVSRYSFGHGFRNQKLGCSRCGVDAKKFALSSSVWLRFFTSFATNWQRISVRPLCLCRPTSSGSLCENHNQQLGRDIHLHLEVFS